MELRLENLTKRYKNTTALDGVNLIFTPGIYGLLGPNGSGKSTLMNLITGNIFPTSGQILWDGQPIRKLGKTYRSLIGYVPQQQALFPDFPVRMFLDYISVLKEIPTEKTDKMREEILKKVGLFEQSEYKIHMLSGGMKQRLLIAQAVLGEPKILIMDEPTVGLDPGQRIQIRNLIREVSENKIVLIATHIVSDLESLSNQVILIKKGCILKQESSERLIYELQEEVKDRTVKSLEDVYLYYFGEQG